MINRFTVASNIHKRDLIALLLYLSTTKAPIIIHRTCYRNIFRMNYSCDKIVHTSVNKNRTHTIIHSAQFTVNIS